MTVLHVYKAVSYGKNTKVTTYQQCERGEKGPGVARDLKNLAEAVKQHHVASGDIAYIDFSPEHDAIFFEKTWYRCFPLSEKEREEFWEVFAS